LNSDKVKVIWETVPVPHGRSSGEKAAISELGSCARLYVGSCVGGSESRTTAGLCNCLNTATVAPGWCARGAI